MRYSFSAATTALALLVISIGHLQDTKDRATDAAVLAINIPMILACKKAQFAGIEALYNNDDVAFNRSQEMAAHCSRLAQVVSKANAIVTP